MDSASALQPPQEKPAGPRVRRHPGSGAARTYVLATSAVGLGILALVLVLAFQEAQRASPAATTWLLVGGLAVGAGVLQQQSFTFPWRAHAIVISLDEVVVFLSFLTLPPEFLVAVVAPGVLVAQLMRRRSFTKVAFNLAVHALSVTGAVLLHAAVAPAVGAVPAAMAATLAYATGTNLLVSGVFARLEGTSSLRVFMERMLLPTGIQVSVGIAAGTALLALWGYHPFAIAAILPLPFLVRGYMGMRAVAEAESDARRHMSELARRMPPGASDGEFAERILDACLDILEAYRVTLVLEGTESSTWSRTVRETRRGQVLEEPLRGLDGARLGTLRVQVDRLDEPRGRRDVLLQVIAREAAASLEGLRMFRRERAARAAAEQAARERAQSLLALAASESRLQAILDHSPAVMFVKDLEGRLVLANPGFLALVGRDAGEALGLRDADLFPPEAAKVMEENDRLALLSRRPVESEEVVPGPDGPRTFIAIRFPVLDEDGAPTALCGIATDITERKRAQAELDHARGEVAAREKLSALGGLVSGVAHEIRTPLTYIANHLFLLRQGLQGLEAKHPDLRAEIARLEGHIDAATDGSDRVNRLVKGLRRYTQVHPEERSEAGLHEVVADVLDLFRATNRGHVVLEADLQPTPPLLLDRLQVQQVVLNLLVNAAEAMPHGGTVRIATRPAQGGAEVVVDDEGPGLPDEVRQRMFEPFFTTKQEGTGLGLSIVQRIVEAHGGRIEASSQPGMGTRFSIWFPASGSPPLPRP